MGEDHDRLIRVEQTVGAITDIEARLRRVERLLWVALGGLGASGGSQLVLSIMNGAFH